jgi:glycosyltransferase involved in cell wall biosynthesis
LIKTDPNLYLTLVGDGPDRGRMESYCKSRGLDGKVKLAGRLSQEQLLPLYREASVFVMPSLEEALGNAVLEAMAAGLPIVTTPTGARELLDGNGLVVERGDSEAMLAALERYAREPDLRLAHGARSRELAESMSWEATARAYRETYERVLDPKTIRED